MQAWTDYPMLHLGDEPEKEAPIREVEVICYDTDKYVIVKLAENDEQVSFKRFYLYTQPVRYDDAERDGLFFDVHQEGIDQDPSMYATYFYRDV